MLSGSPCRSLLVNPPASRGEEKHRLHAPGRNPRERRDGRAVRGHLPGVRRALERFRGEWSEPVPAVPICDINGTLVLPKL